ncbi:MAG: hypothetical protein R2795_26255 [Saprospiraceae bacterium]
MAWLYALSVGIRAQSVCIKTSLQENGIRYFRQITKVAYEKKTAMIKITMAADKNPTSKGDFANLYVEHSMNRMEQILLANTSGNIQKQRGNATKVVNW